MMYVGNMVILRLVRVFFFSNLKLFDVMVDFGNIFIVIFVVFLNIIIFL